MFWVISFASALCEDEIQAERWTTLPIISLRHEIPRGLSVGCLHLSHSSRIAPLWDYGPSANKENYLAGLISSFPSIAVYDRLTTDLLAWLLCYEDGALGHLYVSPSVRRRELASLLVTRMATTLRNQGRTPYTYIDPDNKHSYQLHKKLGFTAFRERLSWVSCVKQTWAGCKIL